MKRIVSGIKPSGDVTLGNYLGAMKRWAERQDGSENFYFIANLHAITVRQDPKELAERTYGITAWLLAMGVNPKRSAVFVQSQVPAHSEMAWILNNYVTFGELSRMTQFKDKSQRLGPEGQLAGLFDYPVLMAADILMYDADEVPVGEDQKQHVELTRDIATRFNNLYGDTFKVPDAAVQEEGARIMSLTDPTSKMSKSGEDPGGYILLEDDADTIRQKIRRAVTDSGSVVQAADDKPALTNLLVIYSLLSGRQIGDIEADYAGKGYGDFKSDLAELVAEKLTPVRKRYQELMGERTELEEVLKQGMAKAASLAEAKLAEVKGKIGLL